MNLQTALNILGLNSNYTEEELNKAYKKAAKKYHPDLFEQKTTSEKKYAENKMKEINEAKTFLEENLKSKKQAENDTLIINLKNDALEYLKKMKISCTNFLNTYTYIFNDEISNNIKQEIKSLENKIFIKKILITSATSKSEIDNCLKEIKIQIKETYVTIKNIFYQEKYINPNKVKITINYDCNLIDFYNQLIKIEELYSETILFNKIIEEIIHTYKNYQGYEQIKDLINFYLNQAKNKAKQNKYQNNDEIIKEVHELIQNIFKEYHELKIEINNLETIINQTKDDEIKELYNKTKKDFELGTNFHDIRKAIDKLKIACEKAIEKLNKIDKEKPKTTELYHSLLSKANFVLTNLNIVDDLDKISKIYEIISKIIEKFKLYTNNLIDIDELLKLNEITFENLDEDLLKLNNIHANATTRTRFENFHYSKKENTNHHPTNYQSFDEPIEFNDTESNKKITKKKKNGFNY